MIKIFPTKFIFKIIMDFKRAREALEKKKNELFEFYL
jgi:hypothetical protein